LTLSRLVSMELDAVPGDCGGAVVAWLAVTEGEGPVLVEGEGLEEGTVLGGGLTVGPAVAEEDGDGVGLVELDGVAVGVADGVAEAVGVGEGDWPPPVLLVCAVANATSGVFTVLA
jgi:hypothetical protein